MSGISIAQDTSMFQLGGDYTKQPISVHNNEYDQWKYENIEQKGIFAKDSEVYFFNYAERGNEKRVTVLGDLGSTLETAKDLRHVLPNVELVIYEDAIVQIDNSDLGKPILVDPTALSLEKTLGASDTRKLMCGMNNELCEENGDDTPLGKFVNDYCDQPGSQCVHVPVQCVGCCIAGAPCCSSCSIGAIDTFSAIQGNQQLFELSR